MGFMDELKKLARPYAEDDDDFDEELDSGVSNRSEAPARERYSDTSLDSGYSRGSERSSSDRFDNVADIAEHLREKRAVVLNLETASKDVARRLVDFLSGCAYALDGKIKKIAASTYIITPYNVDIVGDLIDELESSGLYL